MTLPVPKARDIFLEAVEIGSPEQRATYLNTACAGDRELRRRVEALLAAHERSESLLDRAAVLVGAPALPYASSDMVRLAEAPGTVIGPYTLLERIGEGGMGLVYRAEQTEPLRRRVALKVIKPGMDSEQVLTRFEAERHALALMDHPSIAKVLDAGTTSLGRPFFVMELVEGIPITRYCDEARLSPRQRLELFIPVCQAIQHAHQKGIIHRDIKPSNVLVTLVDGQPLPKVIDFGVAKAIDQRLTERTLFTRMGSIIGTPEYMSPEQAAPSEQDIDTRTDIYSLGVLLYELLTGSTPLDRVALHEAGLEVLLRHVREEEPPKPSTRLSGTNERLPSVAAQRGTEPARLSKLVRGELDWVVMKALEKDRARRYETASAFAADVRRYLDGDPVEAGPPSRFYRLRKFARKRRVTLVVAAGFAVMLVAATLISTWQAVRATRAEDLAVRRLGEVERANAATAAALKQSGEALAQAEAVTKYLTEAFRSPDPVQDGRQVKVADVLDRAVEKLDKEFVGSSKAKASLLEALGLTYYGLGLYDRAVETFGKSRALREEVLGPDHVDTVSSLVNIANASYAGRRFAEAIALHGEALRRREASLGPDHPDTLKCRNDLATAYSGVRRYAEAIAMHEGTLDILTAKLGQEHFYVLAARNNLAQAYTMTGRYAEAIPMLDGTLKLRERIQGPDHPETLTSRNGLAETFRQVGRVAEAIALHEVNVALLEKKLGHSHSYAGIGRTNLALAYESDGRWAKAEALWREAVAQPRKPGDSENRLHANMLAALGNNLLHQAKWAEAEKLLRECLAIRAAKLPDDWSRFNAMSQLGAALLGQGRHAEAEPLIVQGYEGMKAREDKTPVRMKSLRPEAAERVVRLYEVWGKPERAAAWKAKLGLVDLPAKVFAPR
jgi:serine/threonine protein kinase/tetratricopeptide (TPR) repeat protein